MLLTTDIFLITGIYDDDPEIITLSYSDFGGCVNNTYFIFLFYTLDYLPQNYWKNPSWFFLSSVQK